MKKAILLLLLSFAGLALTAPDSFGRFDIPEDAYRMHELGSALQNAKDDDWALTFLLASEETTCSLGTTASLHAIDELEKESIIVYVDAFNNELAQCPEIVRKAFQSSKAGRKLPIAVITDSKCKRVIEIVPYVNSEEAYLNLLRAADKRIKEKPTLRERFMSLF